MEVATDIDRLIERRADKNPDPDETEASYMESVRAYHARQQRDHLEERRLFHRRMLDAHTRTFMELLERHRAGLERCEAMLGIQANNERKETA